VNVALTIATLGFYSPWAKVRRAQYFHRNLRVAGAGFDFDANPWAILRGRALAIALLVGVQLASRTSAAVSAVAGLLFVALLPWLVTASLRFRLYHTLHRGLRFSFHGSVAEAFRAFLAWPLAAALSLGLLLPTAIQRRQRFVYAGSAFGGTRFESAVALGAIYRLCFGTSWIALGSAAVAGWATSSWLSAAGHRIGEVAPDAAGAALVAPILGGGALFVAGLVVAGAYLQVRLHNLVWNDLRLGPHRFRSHQTLGACLALQLGNLLGVVATLGLFLPFAEVRSARWRAACTEVVPGASLDEIAAGTAQAQGAAADELAEIFGFDVGF